MERSTIGDIRDGKKLEEALHSFSPDIVFHLAAQPLVITGIDHPMETFETNIMGTVHALEALRSYNKTVVAVMASSDKCYKNQYTTTAYVETDMLGGNDPYTASKACTEIVIAAYRESYFNDRQVSVASVRAGNVLGGGDFAAHRLLPDLCRAAQNHTPIILRNSRAIRPWQYILDVLWGYLTLAGSMCIGGAGYASEYNFAPPPASPMAVKDIISHVLPLWGLNPNIVQTHNAVHNETQTLLIDASKAEHILGWKCMMDNNAMLDETAGWYQRYLKNDPALADYTRLQADNYLEKVTGNA